MAEKLSTNLGTVAVGAVIKDAALKSAKSALPVGVSQVDVTVRVRGTITKGEEYEQEVSAKIPWERIALALFDKVARQIGPKATMAAIESLAKAEPLADFRDNLNAAGQTLALAMRAKATQVCEGKTTTALVIEEIKSVITPANAAKAA